jgi:hypothetical protein
MRFARTLLVAAILCVAAGSAFAQTTYTCALNGASEVPANGSPATGAATVVLNAAQTQLSITVTYAGLSSAYTASHIHGPAAPGVNASVRWGFVGVAAGWVFGPGTTSGTLTNFLVTSGITAADIANLNNGLMYVNIHSQNLPGGEIRGQLVPTTVDVAPATWSQVKELMR